MAEMVSASEAARRLGLNRSTVSRQLAKFGIARDAVGLLDMAEYRAAREGELNPLKARNKPDPFDHLGEDYDAGGASDPPPANGNGSAGAPTLKTAAMAEKGYRAALLKLEFEQRKGLVVATVETEAAAFDAGRRLRDAILAVPRDLADELAGESDRRKVRHRLDAALREALEAALDDPVSAADG